MIQNKALIDRFLRYARIDTQSQEETEAQPSTAKQRDLAKLLYEELLALGAETYYDEEHCYVYASLPGEEPALGFVSHMDTSPAASGKGVNPRIIDSYDGKDIRLNDDTVLSPSEFPELLSHAGEDLIVTDGTTLLGADDKAGVAEIMNLFAWYAAHPEEPHRKLCLAFTPDEEVGRGTVNFDIERFGAKEAYTVDGGSLGEIEYECFNGASAKVEIAGKSVHPGSGKNTLVNACTLAMELNALLPPAEVPEHTEGYEGYYFLTAMEGDCEHACLKYIIRDHDRANFEARKDYLRRAVDYCAEKYGRNAFRLTLRDDYYNMADLMKDRMDLITRAKDVMTEMGIEPKVAPIRGGTDGAVLTYMGIPCPNLCTGGYNFHGRFEYASIQEMEKSAELLIRLARPLA